LADKSTAAKYLSSTYRDYIWTRFDPYSIASQP